MASRTYFKRTDQIQKAAEFAWHQWVSNADIDPLSDEGMRWSDLCDRFTLQLNLRNVAASFALGKISKAEIPARVAEIRDRAAHNRPTFIRY